MLIGLASAVLTWVAPTLYDDDISPLVVASYRAERGTCVGEDFGDVLETFTIPGELTAFEVLNLGDGEHCFRVFAADAAGSESVASNTAKKTVLPPPPPPPPPEPVTIRTKVWDRLSNGNIGKVVGSIPLGVTCIGPRLRRWTTGEEFYEVPRAAVTLTTKPRSTQLVGVCAIPTQ